MQIFGNESVNHSDASDASLLHWALRSAVFRVATPKWSKEASLASLWLTDSFPKMGMSSSSHADLDFRSAFLFIRLGPVACHACP